MSCVQIEEYVDNIKLRLHKCESNYRTCERSVGRPPVCLILLYS